MAYWSPILNDEGGIGLIDYAITTPGGKYPNMIPAGIPVLSCSLYLSLEFR